MSSRLSLDSLPERYRQQAEAQLAGKPPPPQWGQGQAKAKGEATQPVRGRVGRPPGSKDKKPRKSIRQDKELTGLESDFLGAWTRRGHKLERETLGLRLANGVRYKCDFFERHEQVIDGKLYVRFDAYETKGFKRADDALVIKFAAQQYPWIRFHMVTRHPELHDPWLVQEVLP